MSIPVVYSEDQLKAYLILVLGECAGVLGWSASTPQLDEVLTETLIVYGASTLTDCADVPRLRVLARWRVWQAAVDALAGLYDVGAVEGNLSRSQAFQQASKRLAAAQTDALPLVAATAPGAGSYRVGVVPVTRTDPYA